MAEPNTTGSGKYMSFITNRLLENTVWTFAELSIADLLAAVDKSQTAEELARKQGWNSEYLYRLLRTVTDVNIVREIKFNQTIEPEKTNRFELTEHGLLLTSDHPSKIRYLLYWDGPNKGTGVQYVISNQSTFDFFQEKENKKIASGFNEAVTCISKNNSQPLINTIDFSRFNKIVDIGGGLGAKERTQWQYEYLLKQGGFQLKQLHYTETPISISEVVPN
ncbi:unnamed protein product [Adineta steineri]|uniref:O-methyltransferase dimerisation domain-containing protein n=1 Tax=Adineta steineri TaxID=433720 RepID=A0A813THQ5_9BILA|nr:unnamed protein product [Adineta steineri]CAF3529435.1 unnamed protein product [Adineta steineri]